jgi:hypothetical protein
MSVSVMCAGLLLQGAKLIIITDHRSLSEVFLKKYIIESLTTTTLLTIFVEKQKQSFFRIVNYSPKTKMRYEKIFHCMDSLPDGTGHPIPDDEQLQIDETGNHCP